MADDRKSRKEELLAAARDRLTEEETQGESQAKSTGGSAPGSPPAQAEIRYRGRVVRPSSGGTPGSGSGGTRRPTASGSDDIREALQKIKQLYRDGLISRAEAEKKRTEILDRL